MSGKSFLVGKQQEQTQGSQKAQLDGSPKCRRQKIAGGDEGVRAGERPGLRRSRLFRDTPRDVETEGRRPECREQKSEGAPVFSCLPSAVSSSVSDSQICPEESALPHSP